MTSLFSLFSLSSVASLALQEPVALLHSAAAACPSCGTSDAVWSAIYRDGFWSTLAVVALPFTVLSVLCYGVARRGHGSGEHR